MNKIAPEASESPRDKKCSVAGCGEPLGRLEGPMCFGCEEIFTAPVRYSR